MKTNPVAWLSELLLSLTAIPVLLMMVHITADVVLKYTLNAPIQGTLEISAYYYMVSIVVLPMAFVELTRQSIAVDLFYQMMPPRMQLAVVFAVLLIVIAGYGGLAWISWPDAIVAFERREIVSGTVNIQIWPTRFLLPVALTLTSAVCLVQLVRLFTDPATRARLVAVHGLDPYSAAE